MVYDKENSTSNDSSYVDEFGIIKVTPIHSRSSVKNAKSHMSLSSEISIDIEAPPSESAQHIASNEDLLTEILLHLPPRSLLRFQTVSKQWFSIITSPLFRHLHTRRSSASTIGFFLCWNPTFNYLSLREEDFLTMSMMNERFSRIRDGKIICNMNSCNGLFCLDFKLSDGKREFYICNLTTGKYRLIPLPDTTGEPHLVKTMNLAFDPEKPEDYDVVCIRLSVSENQLRFAVYFFRFRSMPSTPIPEGQCDRNIEYFGESGGHLHLIDLNPHTCTKFDIWEMEVNYYGWFVKYHVDLDFLPNLYPNMVNQEVNPPEDYAYSNVFSTICFLEDEKDEAMLVLALPGKIILYKLGKNGMIKELADVKPASLMHFLDGARYNGFDMYKYVETLACV